MQNKVQIRKELLSLRDKMDAQEVMDKSNKIVDFLLASDVFQDAKTVLSYLPLGNEVKTDKIHRFLWENDISVLVPYTDEHYNIHACKLDPESVLKEGKFHVKIPEKLKFFEGTPDVVIVPCVGMDKDGNRIGFGKGCYDRYLRDHRTKSVAILYGFQVVSPFEVSQFDIPIGRILTEEGFIK